MSIIYEKWKWLREEINSFIEMINHLPNKGTYKTEQTDIDWFNKINQSVKNLIAQLPENRKKIETLDFEQIAVSFGLRVGSYLSKLRMEIDEYFLDVTKLIRQMTDDALAHLQLMIAIDSQYQNNWKWGANETHYEKFGAAHLLLHRIWSFKAKSQKSSTDLILIEPIETTIGFDNINLKEKTFILTEWKKYDHTKDNLDKLIESAVTQMKEYVSPHLHTLPFEPVCYLIIVSENNQKNIDSQNNRFDIRGFKIKVVNIICNPETPSKTR
jgi:hypothetical protein